MRQITIDCNLIPDAPALHRALAEALRFPAWYGSNLDALHDCLTELLEDTTLILAHFDTLGSFRAGFRLVLNEAEDENPHLFVTL